jgi:hypothetical protein
VVLLAQLPSGADTPQSRQAVRACCTSRRDSRSLAQLRPLSPTAQCVCARASVPKTGNAREMERSAYRARQQSCVPWQCPLVSSAFGSIGNAPIASIRTTLSRLIFGVRRGTRMLPVLRRRACARIVSKDATGQAHRPVALPWKESCKRYQSYPLLSLDGFDSCPTVLVGLREKCASPLLRNEGTGGAVPSMAAVTQMQPITTEPSCCTRHSRLLRPRPWRRRR